MSMLLLCSKTAANLCGSFGVKIVFFYVVDCNSAFHYSSNMSTKKKRKINIEFFFGGKLKEQNRKRKIISILSYVIWYNVVLSHYRTFRKSKIAASWQKIYRFPVFVHDEEKLYMSKFFFPFDQPPWRIRPAASRTVWGKSSEVDGGKCWKI